MTSFRILCVSQAQFDHIWNDLQPQLRCTVNWIPTCSLLTKDEQGTLVVMVGEVEMLSEPPQQFVGAIKKAEAATRAEA